MRKSHCDIAATIGHFFEAFQSYVGEDKLKHIASPQGVWKPLSPRRLSNAVKRMSVDAPSGAPNACIQMKGPGQEQDVGDYGFFYIGNDIDAEIKVHSLEHGLASVAGGELKTGDITNRLTLTRKVAALLEELSHVPSWGAYGFRTEEPMTHFQAWLRRHLDEKA